MSCWVSTQSPKKENGQKAPCHSPGNKGRISQFGHQQSFHHFLSLQFLSECLCTGCQRNRLPSGVDGLHCGDGLCQRPQGCCWNQWGRLARTAWQFTVSKVCSKLWPCNERVRKRGHCISWECFYQRSGFCEIHQEVAWLQGKGSASVGGTLGPWGQLAFAF